MSLITEVLNQYVGKVEVRTAYGPTITIDDPFSSSPSTGDSELSKLLKPSIDIYSRTSGGISADPTSFAPYGDPGQTKWPFLVAGLGFVVGWLTFRAFGRR